MPEMPTFDIDAIGPGEFAGRDWDIINEIIHGSRLTPSMPYTSLNQLSALGAVPYFEVEANHVWVLLYTYYFGSLPSGLVVDRPEGWLRAYFDLISACESDPLRRHSRVERCVADCVLELESLAKHLSAYGPCRTLFREQILMLG
jgi:hypothetical protein